MRKNLLDDIDYLREMLISAADNCGAAIIGHIFKKFEPQGVSGVVVIAESHISLHTWPEYGYAALDVFTCGNKAVPDVAVEHVVSSLKPKNYSIVEMKRGILVSNSQT